MVEQLALPLILDDYATFENFHVGGNQHVLDMLHRFLSYTDETFMYLWGDRSVGRTHLLQACCHAWLKEPASGDVLYLPLKNTAMHPSILDGMEQDKKLVCIDDLDAVLGQPLWEEGLLHFYNRARAHAVHVVVVGSHIPPQLACQLADLQSRLSWGLVFNVVSLNDAEKIEALQMRARARGFDLTQEVGYFLLSRYPRDMSVLFELLYTLERASLALQRKITVPFVKDMIGLYLKR